MNYKITKPYLKIKNLTVSYDLWMSVIRYSYFHRSCWSKEPLISYFYTSVLCFLVYFNDTPADNVFFFPIFMALL